MPEQVGLWRAVDAVEKADIESVGRFRLPAGSGSGIKYFALDRTGAVYEGWALSLTTKVDHLWLAAASAPARLLAPGRRHGADTTPFGNVALLLLDGADLRQLGPASIIERLELPP